MATTVATIDVGGTGATTAAGALTALGAAPIAAYAQANSAYTAANNASTSANNAVLKAGDTMTGALALSAGNSAAPAITRSGDTDTGVYFPAANEMAVTTGGTVAAAFNSNGLFFRNRIINGDMRIDQRNAGASITPSSQYTVDRWLAQGTQASKYSTQRNAGSVTPPTGFSNYLGITSLSAYSVLTGDTFLIDQRIEGFNFSDMEWGTANARTITFSFWVRSSLTGTFGGAMANSAGNRSYTFSYTISSANTWEYKTITVPGDTTGTWVGSTNGVGVIVRFGLGSGSTYTATANSWAAGNFVQPTSTTSVVGTNGATLYITGVQLETGSVATPFERRPYGTELMLCQRYYQTVSSVPAVASSTTEVFAGGTFPVPMRASPTVGATGTLNYQGDGVINATQSSVTVPYNYANSESLYTQFGNFTGLTQSRTLFLGITVNNNNKLTLSAEL